MNKRRPDEMAILRKRQVKIIMTVIPVSKRFFVSIALPGMGRSIDLINQPPSEVQRIRHAFQAHDLAIEFQEEPGITHPVVQIWVNPHGDQVTLFI